MVFSILELAETTVRLFERFIGSGNGPVKKAGVVGTIVNLLTATNKDKPEEVPPQEKISEVVEKVVAKLNESGQLVGKETALTEREQRAQEIVEGSFMILEGAVKIARASR